MWSSWETCSSNILPLTCDDFHYVNDAQTNCTLCSDITGGLVKTCDSATNHFNCTESAYLFNGSICTLCTSIHAEWTKCTLDGAAATACLTGFYLSNGTCLDCTLVAQGWLTCNSNTFALSCSDEFFLDSYGCTRCNVSNSAWKRCSSGTVAL